MKHLGLLLLLFVIFTWLDLRDSNNSALLGTGYFCKGQKLVPYGAALLVWTFFEVIYLIVYWFFL